MEYVTLILLGIFIGRLIGLYFEYKEYQNEHQKTLDRRQENIENIQETDLRDEVPYESVKRLVELTNLINYNGSSKGQVSLKAVDEYYGKDGD